VEETKQDKDIDKKNIQIPDYMPSENELDRIFTNLNLYEIDEWYTKNKEHEKTISTPDYMSDESEMDKKFVDSYLDEWFTKNKEQENIPKQSKLEKIFII
jgi:hypothetical protein